MPYASAYHDVMVGYGLENQRKLRSVTRKYDPRGSFRCLQSGEFRLNGVPEGLERLDVETENT